MIKAAIEAFSLFVKDFEPNTKYLPGSPFLELERLPGIILEGPVVAEDRRMDYSRRPEFTKTGKGYSKQPGAKHYNLDFTITILSKGHEDLIRIMTDFTAHVAMAVDLEFADISCYMRIVNGFTTANTKNISGICEAKATVRIESVPLLSRVPVQDVASIEKIAVEISDKGGNSLDGQRIK